MILLLPATDIFSQAIYKKGNYSEESSGAGQRQKNLLDIIKTIYYISHEDVFNRIFVENRYNVVWACHCRISGFRGIFGTCIKKRICTGMFIPVFPVYGMPAADQS